MDRGRGRNERIGIVFQTFLHQGEGGGKALWLAAALLRDRIFDHRAAQILCELSGVKICDIQIYRCRSLVVADGGRADLVGEIFEKQLYGFRRFLTDFQRC